MKKGVLPAFKTIPTVQKVGVYAIHNKANGKYYIGSSSNIYTRLKYHNSNGTNREMIFDRVKYSPSMFELLILETYENGSITFEELRRREDYYIKKYNSIEKGYNVKSPIAMEKRYKELVYCREVKLPNEKHIVTLPNGTKDRIKAATGGESVNGFINRLVAAELERIEGGE